jgi:peroxiredoxin Q/BCP
MGLLDFLGGGEPGVKVGDRAPEFSLSDASGHSFRLADLRGKKPVVLYFYPKDDTPGCTKEACGFRDQYEEFQKLGAEVVGISSDSSASHQRFAAKHQLPFTLLADEGGAVRRLYGVPATLGLLPGRVTFVIDREGVVRHVLNSQLAAKRHVAEALATLDAQAASEARSEPKASGDNQPGH